MARKPVQRLTDGDRSQSSGLEVDHRHLAGFAISVDHV
jgi:hypothetical protein